MQDFISNVMFTKFVMLTIQEHFNKQRFINLPVEMI